MEKFLKSTLILLIGGFITKTLGMLIKIIMTRSIGAEGIGLYMMILPTFTLFISLAQFGFPIALSKLVAENKKNNKQLVMSIIPVSFLINICLIIFIIVITPFLSQQLLHEPRTYYPLLAIALVIPLTSLSSIVRSYFFGKEEMFPHVLSNVTEDIIRLLLVLFGIPMFLTFGIEIAVTFVVLTNIISELVSILILLFFLPKKAKIKKKDLRPRKSYIKESLSIGIPNTTSKLVGSIGYFLEPILLMNILLFVGYNQSFILTEYGIFSGFVLPLLLLPSFFTLAISQALLPVISREYTKKNFSLCKRKIKQAIFFSLLIGFPVTIFFVLAPDIPLMLIYNTKEGASYLRFLAPICLFQYIQAPLSFSLDAMGKGKDAMFATLFGVITRSSLLLLLSLFRIGLWGLIIATSINVFIVTIHNYKKVRFHLKTPIKKKVHTNALPLV